MRENLIQPCSHSEAAFIALSNRLPIMVVIEKSSILILGVLILISHLIFCDFALSSFSAIKKYYEYIHEFSYHCAVKHNHQLLSDGFSYHVLKSEADLIYRRAGQNIPVPFYQVQA